MVDDGMGTRVATTLPYSIAFFLVWTALLAIWTLLGLPLGPGAAMFLETGTER